MTAQSGSGGNLVQGLGGLPHSGHLLPLQESWGWSVAFQVIPSALGSPEEAAEMSEAQLGKLFLSELSEPFQGQTQGRGAVRGPLTAWVRHAKTPSTFPAEELVTTVGRAKG
jgi:hypothetical protein